MSRSCVLWSMVALVGCSGSGSPDAGNGDQDSGNPDSGTPTPSTLTATGALTGSITGQAPIVGHSADSDTSTFSLIDSTGGQAFTVNIAIGFGAAPATQAYSGTTAGFSCDVSIADGTAPANTWVANDNHAGTPDAGTCSLSFSSVGIAGTQGYQGYPVHGALAITAQSSGGAASGTVTLNGTF